MKKIGFILEVQGAKDTVAELAKLELQLAEVSKEIRAAKKAGDEELYASLRAEQLELQASTRDLRKELREQEKDFKAARFPTDSLEALRLEYRQLRREQDKLSTADPKFKEQARELSVLSDRINDAKKEMGDFTSNIGRYEEAFTSALDAAGNAFSGDIASLAAGLGAGGAIVAGLDALQQGVQIVRDLTQEFVVLRGEVNQLTGATGDDLDNISIRVAAVADTFDQDYNEVLRASNALTQQLTGDFDTSLDLIEKGFLSGGNASNELLDSLKEYPTFFKEAGLSGQQLISVITQSVQDGLFSDKGVDAIKEATIRLRELPQSTRDALIAIGFESEEIRRLIDEEGIGAAISAVSGRLNELQDDSPEVGQALADIFGGAGEDAGLAFIKSLEGIDDAIDSNIDSTNQLVIQQKTLLDVNEQFAASQNELAKELGATDGSLKTVGIQIKTVLIDLLLLAIERSKPFIEQLKNIISNLEPVGELFLRLFNLGKSFAAGLGLISEETAKANTSFNLLGKLVDLAVLPFTILNKGIEKTTELLGFFAKQYNRFLDFIGQSRPANTQSTESINENIELITGSTKKAEESYSKYVSAVTDGSKEIEKATDNTKKTIDSTAAATERLASTSLLALQREVQRLQTELTKAPSEDSGLIAGIKQQIEEAERRVIDAQIAIGQLTAPTQVQELQTVQTLDLIPNEIQPLEDQGRSDEVIEEEKIEREKTEIRAAAAANNLEIAQNLAEDEAVLRDQRLESEQELQEQLARIGIEAAEATGRLLGELFSGQIEDFKDFQKQLLLIALDALEKTLQIQAAAAIAREFGTKGFAGAITGALIAGAITALFSGVKSQIENFADGGRIPALSDGRITQTSNTRRHPSGDNVLAYVKTGELIMNQKQQQKAQQIYGNDIFANLGIPNFVDGGVVGGNVPQLVNPNQFISTTAATNATLSLSDEDIDRLADAVATGSAIGSKQGINTGYTEAQKAEQRQKTLNQQLEN
jgi:hypothetical protein